MIGTTLQQRPGGDLLPWSPTDHSQYVGIINGAYAARISQTGSAYQSARSDLPLPPGITTVQFFVTQVGSGEGTGPGMRLGVANGVASLANYGGATNDGCTYQSTNGNVVKNAGVTGNAGSFTTGDVISMVVDMTGKTVKFSKNGGAFSADTDITSLGDDVYVCASLGNGNVAPVVRATGKLAVPVANPTLNVLNHGDSISLIGGVQRTYLQRLVALIDAGAETAQWKRNGINGASWDYAWSGAGYPYTMLEDAPIRVDPFKSATLDNWLILFAGTNGITLGSRTAATEYSHFQTYVAARVAAGWEADKIIVCTMLPRTGVNNTTHRGPYNAALVGDSGAVGYRVARLDLDPDVGADGQNLDTDFFYDGTHPTDAGHVIIAQIIYDTMFP